MVRGRSAEGNRAIGAPIPSNDMCQTHAFDKLFQHHERQPLQEVGTKATSPRSIFTKKIAQIETAAEEEVYRAVNMTADKRVEFQVRLSDAETEATTWSLADIDRIVSQLEREIHVITSNE